MTQVIDGRVVEMKFDNSDFEKNVAQSMSTLDKLKQALNFDSAKSLQDIGRASKSFTLDPVASAVDVVQARFSALQVVGITALSELTKAAISLGGTMINAVVGPIKQGGLNRALNIEQAKFQLEGLEVAWEAVADDIDYAVKGTAYGLDAAAKAAAQLSASSVEAGDAMKKALRGISGVAAMTNSSYDDIAQIFTTVAGNGRVMASELNRIGMRGLNAASALATYFNEVNAGTTEATEEVVARVKEITGGLNVTEADIREFCSKGKINFELFASAMDSAFGEHAKAANNTFTGALANVKAALSRIGAKVYTPGLENLRKVFVELIGLIDKFSNIMEKPIDFINTTFEKITGNLQSLFRQTDKFEQLFTNISDGLGQALYDILRILIPIRDGFRQVFPPVTFDNVINLTAKIRDFLATLRVSQETGNNIARIFRGVASVFNIFKMAIEAIVDALFPAAKGLGSFGAKVIEVLAYIGDWVYIISEVIRQNNLFGMALDALKSKAIPIFKAIGKGIKFVSDLFKDFFSQKMDGSGADALSKTAGDILSAVNPLEKAAAIIKFVFGGIVTALGEASPLIGAFAKLIGTALGEIGNGLTQVFSGGGFKTLLAAVNSALLVTIGLDIANFVRTIMATVSKGFNFMTKINTIMTSVTNSFKLMNSKLRAGVLLDIAKAIGILAASLWALSTIPADKLAQSIGAIVVLFAGLAGMMIFLESFATEWKNVAAMFTGGIGFAAIATGVLILAGALKMLASIDSESLNAALGAMTYLLIELTAVTLILGKNAKKIEAGSAAILAFAFGIKILASAVKSLSKLSPEELKTGFEGLTGVMLELIGAVLILRDSKFGTKEAAAILVLSIALNALSAALKSFGDGSYETLAKGLVAMGAALVEVAIFLDVMGQHIQNALGSAAAFTILAVGITFLSNAIQTLGNLPLDGLVAGVTALGAALLVMSLVFKVFESSDPAKMILAAAAMTILSVSMTILAGAIALLANLGIEKVGEGILAFVATLVVLGVAGAIFGATLSIMLQGAIAIAALGIAAIVASAGIAAAALSIGLLASAFETMAEVGWDKFGSALEMLGAAFIVIAGGLMLLTPVAPVLLTFTVALIGIAAASQMFAIAIGIAAVSLTAFAVAFKMFESIDPVAIALGLGTLALTLGAFALLAPVLAPLGATLLMIGGGFALIGVGAAGVAAAILLLTMAFERLGPLLEQAYAAFQAFNDGLWQAIGDAVGQIGNILNAAGQAILGFTINLFASLIGYFLEGCAVLVQTFVNLGLDLLKALGVPEDYVNLAKEFVNGLISGIKEKIKDAVDAVKSLGNSLIDAAKDVLQIHSPSQVMYDLGLNFDDGWANGITAGGGKVIAAVTDVGSGMITQAQSDASTVFNIWDTIGSYGSGYVGTLSHKSAPSKATKEMRELNKEMKDLKGNSKEAKTGIDDLALSNDKFAKSAGGAGKAAKEEKSFFESLTDTLSNQLDIFSKFEIKSDMTSQTLLDNMKSNIDGFASWSHRMTVLAKRFSEHGISDTLYKKLAEMGPKGYETMNAIYQMTDDQLEELRGLWETGLTLPEGQASIVESGFTYMGEMASQGFSNALDAHDAAHAGSQFGKAALDGIAGALAIASPSKETFKLGVYAAEGLGKGMTSESALTYLQLSAKRVTDTILELLNTNLSEDVMAEAGTGILTNLFNGLLGESIEGNPIITAFIETFANFELIDEALTLFSEHVKELLYELFEIAGDEEPSEWFKRLVEISILQTVINTITEKTVDVITAVTTLCKAIIEAAAGIFEMTAGDEGFSRSEVFYQMGVAAVLGLAEGLKDEAAVGQAVEAAVALATAVNNAVANTLEVNSPSKVMIRMGHSVGEGLTIGITDGAENVYSAAKQVAEGTIDAMSDMGRLQEALSTGIDYNPIITPMFDLSYIKEQMSELDGLMNDPEYGLSGQNEGKGGKVTNVNYTQNNYSPKSLTRYEIYRQTQRQISSLKGAMG